MSAQESNLARARLTYLFDVGKHVVDTYEKLAQDMGITVKELVDRAIEAGFSSVEADLSRFPVQENIEKSKV